MRDEQVQVQVVRDEPRSRWVARVDGTEAGFLSWQREPDGLRMTHTVVDPDFEGRGVGGALVRAALAGAREQGDGVLPQCSFVLAHLLRHPEEQDLVPADQRAAYGLPAA